MERFIYGSEKIANGLGLGRLDAEVSSEILKNLVNILELIKQKRQNPGDDLISQLNAMEYQGDQLNQTEFLSMLQTINICWP